jgi:hypothetical protein
VRQIFYYVRIFFFCISPLVLRKKGPSSPKFGRGVRKVGPKIISTKNQIRDLPNDLSLGSSLKFELNILVFMLLFISFWCEFFKIFKINGCYSILIFVLNDANVFSDLLYAIQINIFRKLIYICCKLIDLESRYFINHLSSMLLFMSFWCVIIKLKKKPIDVTQFYFIF